MTMSDLFAFILFVVFLHNFQSALLQRRTLRLPSRLIGLEEHTKLTALGNGTSLMQQILRATNVTQLQDVSRDRLNAMDAGHLSMQNLSHVGVGDVSPSLVHEANDQLAAIVKGHPDRFRFFAKLPMSYPSAAAAELERAVSELGTVGTLLDNTLENGTTYDDEKFWPVFEVAERLGVPIYLHPAAPTQEKFEAEFEGNYDLGVAIRLATVAWGWHQQVGLHVLKLFSAGVFERYSDLKIMLGHDGELLPIFLDRVLDINLRNKQSSFQEVWNRNIWLTIGGIFSVRSLEMVLKVMTIERICYAVDYPFAPPSAGWRFVQELAGSHLLSQHQLDLFAYKNAEILLKLR